MEIGNTMNIKRFIQAMIALAIVALGSWPLISWSQGGRAGAYATTSVNTTSVVLARSNLGQIVIAMAIYNASGTETVRCSFASGTAYNRSSIAINPGSAIYFQSSTYDFVPGGGVWARGNTANATNTVAVEVIV